MPKYIPGLGEVATGADMKEMVLFQAKRDLSQAKPDPRIERDQIAETFQKRALKIQEEAKRGDFGEGLKQVDFAWAYKRAAKDDKALADRYLRL